MQIAQIIKEALTQLRVLWREYSNFLIDKNSRKSLPDQLVRILRQRIECGYYIPGKKFDSVRIIAKAFGVSTASVQTALSL